jgi:predicted ABC-type ATPase
VDLELDQRPVIVAIAGPNGAGKTTFFEAFIRPAALPFVNADEIARELSLDAYAAAEVASRIRQELVARRESFAFETVFSDPARAKLDFLRSAVNLGYTVLLCFVGLDSWASSATRVAMRVSQGGHNVPDEKLAARYPRSLENLAHALRQLPLVYIFDNSNLADPFRLRRRRRPDLTLCCCHQKTPLIFSGFTRRCSTV